MTTAHRHGLHRWSRLADQDAGITLPEILVTIVLMGILGSIMLVAVQDNYRLHRSTLDESEGLGDVRVLTERLTRDLRAARSIDAGADSQQLRIWVDANNDYLHSDDELITWELITDPADPKNAEVVRVTDAGVNQTISRTVFDDLEFCYWVTPPAITSANCTGSLPVPLTAANAEQVKLVTVTASYDARPNSGSDPRTVTFSARLRNVE